MSEESWRVIEAWLARSAPSVVLNPPATERAIADLERRLGVRLPADVRAAYLRHDGQSADSPGLIDAWEWLSLDRIAAEWKVWKDLLDGGDFAGIAGAGDGAIVRGDWWHPAWIPLTYSGSGDHHCVDLAPGAAGRSGQIIRMWHDAPDRPVLAPSFAVLIETLAHDLQADEYVLSDEYGGVMRRDEVE